MSTDNEHPLYPSKEEEVRSINIYELKPCMRCGVRKKDAIWRDVPTYDWSYSESSTDFTRICDSCFEQSSIVWG